MSTRAQLWPSGIFRSEVMPEDMIRIGAYCSEEASIGLASEFLELGEVGR